ncbi:unnamed protein product [Caenorhabditis brenneri]
MERVCPDKRNPNGTCSAIEECPSGYTCYRDVQEKSDGLFGCCESKCPMTEMPYGSQFEKDSQSVISYCSNLDSEQFYLDKTKSEMDLENEEYGCCPMPFSHFLFGRKSGVIGNRTYALPAGWSLDPSTGEVSGIRPCCRPDDCGQNEYCGLVRNPATMSLVYSKTNCGERTDFDGIDGKLRFCYEYPDIDYDSLGITKSMVTDQQLCQTNEDCFNTTHYCEYGKEGGPIKICTPMIGKTIHSIGAKDAFLIYGQGCPHDERCDEKGKPWFSYRCESPDPIMPDEGKVCVGYEIICSDSALYQHGTNFGCKSNFDCLEGFPKTDKIHTPLCIQNPFPGNNKKERTACCYEMKSCTYHLDIHLYGLPPLRSSMCTSNEECQELADDMTAKSRKRDVYLGRCMPETVDNYGKCCIADISSYCSVGKSLIPPQKCSNHTECEFSETTKNWCGDEGYCCEDFKNEESWMCPDGQTIRIHQPKCDVKAGDEEGNWCENKAGYCVMGRCCPAVKPSGDFIHLFAESPWYYPDLNCTDTIDLPPKMDMVYCDPIRHVVTRASRGDWMNSRTVAAFYTYCSSNDNCTDISSSLVCVQEKDGLNRCHSYYDRSIKWYPFVVPTAFFVVLLLIFVFYWRKDLKYEAIEQKEVYY